MTKHGAQQGRGNTVPVQDALQAFADDTKSERTQSPTYRKSRLRILGAVGIASVLTFMGIAPYLKGGEDVDAASSAVAGGDKAASAPANPNRTPGALSFDCALKGITLDTASVSAQSASINLGVKSTGRDHVTYVAPSFIEGTFGDEAPMLGDGGAGESSTIVSVPAALFEKTIGVYALSDAGESARCGAIMYDPTPEDPSDPMAQFVSEADLPATFTR